MSFLDFENGFFARRCQLGVYNPEFSSRSAKDRQCAHPPCQQQRQITHAMDQLFDRAFNKAHGTATAVMGTAAAASPAQKQKQQQQSREAMLRECTTPMTAEDVVERIGIAFKYNDYFR
jgi:hypothetical protein